MLRNTRIDRHKATPKTTSEVFLDPPFQERFLSRGTRFGNASFQLTNGQDAKKQLILIVIGKPLKHARTRFRLDQFCDDAGIQQVTHRETGRPKSELRVISSSTPVNGERRRNSTKVPFRASNFRNCSAAMTTTASAPPWTAITCGPSSRFYLGGDANAD